MLFATNHVGTWTWLSELTTLPNTVGMGKGFDKDTRQIVVSDSSFMFS